MQTDHATRKAAVLDAFRQQIDWCRRLDSPFTAAVIDCVAADIAEDGAFATLTDVPIGDPVAAALPLRVAGALHALVLTRADPELVACYPPNDAPTRDRLQAVLRRGATEHQTFIGTFLRSPPQTNEVGRSAVLLGGFATVARDTGLPLRTLEIGASAGLNGNWDRFHYRLGTQAWGDPASPVHLSPSWEGGAPPLDGAIRVIDRRACDIAPIDLTDPDARLRLRSYVWADQQDRLHRLEAAIGLALSSGLRVEQADAAAWVAARLTERAEGCATVLFHSIMWQYMPAETRALIEEAVAAAGRRSTVSAPFAWLRFEPHHHGSPPELRLTLWPNGEERRLAVAHPHGASIAWTAGA